MSNLDRYLTLYQAARFMGVADETLAKWARGGKVKGYKDPGGRWRFLEADLVAAISPVEVSSDTGEGGS
ncbi:MAG: helix-turn-helix domain-containing protein [Planctomycetota bacterium]|jgi:excisionase family DNA binding protein